MWQQCLSKSRQKQEKRDKKTPQCNKVFANTLNVSNSSLEKVDSLSQDSCHHNWTATILPGETLTLQKKKKKSSLGDFQEPWKPWQLSIWHLRSWQWLISPWGYGMLPFPSSWTRWTIWIVLWEHQDHKIYLGRKDVFWTYGHLSKCLFHLRIVIPGPGIVMKPQNL